MADKTPRPRRNRVAQILSTMLFIAAIGFAAGAAYVWYTQDDNPDGPGTPPPAESGEAELANVVTVLQESNNAWEYGRTTASTNQFPTPGQLLKLNDRSLYVFIFNGPNGEERIASREAASEQIDLEALELTTPSGKVINTNGEHLYMAEASNVITILVGGDQELADRVSSAIANLP